MSNLIMFGVVLTQLVCGTYGEMTRPLGTKYQESVLGHGISSRGILYEVWVSEETGTWTLLRATPDGLSCVIAVGTDWETLPEKSEPTSF